MDKKERKYLKDIASSLIKRLEEVHPGKPFQIKKKVKAFTTKTNGWHTTIGTLTGYNCKVELWFDKFTGYPQRKINYCLYSNRKEQIEKVVTYAKKELGSHISINQDNLSDSAQYVQLAKQLAKSRFGQPILERYSKEYFYGIYEMKRVGLQRNEGKRLIESIIGFTKSIIESLPEWKELKSDSEIYSCIENRKLVTQHLRRAESVNDFETPAVRI